MGIVYRAEDTWLGREVAVRFLPAAQAGDEQWRHRAWGDMNGNGNCWGRVRLTNSYWFAKIANDAQEGFSMQQVLWFGWSGREFAFVAVLGTLVLLALVTGASVWILWKAQERWKAIAERLNSRRRLLGHLFAGEKVPTDDRKAQHPEQDRAEDFVLGNVKMPAVVGTGEIALHGGDESARRLILAVTDAFVEKAHEDLTWRSKVFSTLAAGCGWLALAALSIGAYLLMIRNHVAPRDASDAIVMLAEATAKAAFLSAIPAFLIYLTRALLHEASVQINRRHAIRFGRLFVYLSGNTPRIEDLNRAFNWTGEYDSAFKSIKHEGPKGLVDQVVKLAETAGKIAENAGKVAAADRKG